MAETLEEQIYVGTIQTGDIAFDIGANVGDVAMFLARRIGSRGKVIAFEPVWPVYEQLCLKVRDLTRSNAAVAPVPIGLADFDGTGSIHVPNDIFSLGSLAPTDTWKETQRNATLSSFECTFAKLDTFIARHSLPLPDFIKIDVEGAELLVLHGAKQFFTDGCRPLMLLEIFAPWERALRYEPWDVLSLLLSYGYSFMFACPEGLVHYRPDKAQPFPSQFRNGYNVLAYVPARHMQRIERLKPLQIGGSSKVLPVPPPPRPNKI